MTTVTFGPQIEIEKEATINRFVALGIYVRCPRCNMLLEPGNYSALKVDDKWWHFSFTCPDFFRGVSADGTKDTYEHGNVRMISCSGSEE